MVRSYLLLLCLFVSLSGSATHIVGGELYYKCLGGNSYRITLKLYRDCYLGKAEYDNPVSIGVFTKGGTLLQTIKIPFPGSRKLPPTFNGFCSTPPATVCVEEAIYELDTVLPDIPAGGLILAYQRCCRNHSISNIVEPKDVGSTYVAEVPGPEVVTCNNNPYFKNFPPIYLCIGQALIFDHSAIDPDGDQLFYELCEAYEGATPSAPIPDPPSAPPYVNVPYSSPFNPAKPMASSPELAIDPQTGLLTGTPTQLGQWVIAVCVKEYRGGKFIGTSRRDFQFNVVDCKNELLADVTSQFELTNGFYCSGYTYTLQNKSKNATSYHWDFGVPGVNADTSNAEHPTFTFPDTGTYTVTLIANPGPCADTATTVFTIYPLLDPAITTSGMAKQCFQQNRFDFTSSGSFSNDAKFLWRFSPDAKPDSSTQQNPSGIAFSSPGIKTITLTAAENGCTKSYTTTVEVVEQPNAVIKPQDEFCNGLTVNFKNLSTSATTYFWDFGDPGITSDVSTEAEPSYTYNQEGIYLVTLIVSNGLCNDTAQRLFRVFPLLDVSIGVSDTAMCLEGNIFNYKATGFFGSKAKFRWTFGSNANPQFATTPDVNDVVYSQLGFETATLHVSENGCTDQAIVTIGLHLPPDAGLAIADSQGCAPFTVQFYNKSKGTTQVFYEWTFGDGTTSREPAPSHTYTTPGTYSVSLLAYSTYGCIDSSLVYLPGKITAYPSPKAGFEVTPRETSILDPVFTVTDQSSGATACLLDFNDGFKSDSCSISHAYSDTGKFVINQMVVNEYGCSDIAFEEVNIIYYYLWIPNAFTPQADGFNEVFSPVTFGLETYSMKIYNRWGEMIFDNNGLGTGWNGTTRSGQPAMQDVYVYVLEFKTAFGQSQQRYGHVTLLR